MQTRAVASGGPWETVLGLRTSKFSFTGYMMLQVQPQWIPFCETASQEE